MFFHLNLLSTSKPWHIWCFKYLQIILTSAITYLTLLFHSTNCSFFYSPCLLCMWVILYIFFFVFATSFAVICYRLNTLSWMSFTLYWYQCWCVGQKFCFCWSHSYNGNTWKLKFAFFVSIILLQSMISSGLDLFSFTSYVKYYIIAISSSFINLVLAVAFNQVSSLISILCCFS